MFCTEEWVVVLHYVIDLVVERFLAVATPAQIFDLDRDLLVDSVCYIELAILKETSQ